jgi:hypothetical protein
MSKQVQIDTPVGKPASPQPQPVDLVLRLHQLEGSTQAVLATLRRSLIEKVPQQALAMIDDIAQTVGISSFD